MLSIRITEEVIAKTIAWKKATKYTVLYFDKSSTVNNRNVYEVNNDKTESISKYTKAIYIGIKTANI